MYYLPRELVLSGIAAVLLVTACKQHDSISVTSTTKGRTNTAQTIGEEGAGDSAQRCQSATPAVAPGTQGVAARDIIGSYILTVVAEHGEGRNSAVTGRLVLNPTNAAPEVAHSPVSFPLSGWSSIDLEGLGRVSLAYSASSIDSTRPGVQAIYNQTTGAYTLVFGNAMSSQGVGEDAGVYFDIADVSPTGFSGTWKDGGRIAPLLRGYCCATRVGS